MNRSKTFPFGQQAVESEAFTREPEKMGLFRYSGVTITASGLWKTLTPFQNRGSYAGTIHALLEMP